MKRLQNKKTGEIGYLIAGKGSGYYTVTNDNWESCGKYDSLAKLNEEWEDYEEPEEFWYINECGDVLKYKYDGGCSCPIMEAKEIGNYFETEEEAEKAVEKLKAWKRLKDKGFKFRGWEADSGEEHNYAVIHCFMPSLTRKMVILEPMSFEDIQDDLDLLFGGEE